MSKVSLPVFVCYTMSADCIVALKEGSKSIF